MINHLRSHLLNKIPDDGDYLGAELVDPEYTVVRLPGYLLEVTRSLFGVTPDRDMLNYRVAQLTRIVHFSELRGMATSRDPRITYVPHNNVYVSPAVWQPDIQVTGGGVIVLSETSRVPDHAGVLRQTWRLRLDDESTLSVTDKSGTVYEVEVSNPSSVSNSFLLPGSDRRCSLQGWDPGDTATIQVLTRPRRSIASLLAGLESLPEDRTAQLFGIDTKYYDDPELRQVYDIWTRGREQVLRLAAATVALAISVESLR